MAEIICRVPALHPAQKDILAQCQRFNVLNCGRRFGKSMFGIYRLLMPAIQGYPVAWFAPNYKLLSEVWKDVKERARPISTRVSIQDKRIDLSSGGSIEMWSLDGDIVVRGRKYKHIGVDEAAHVSKLRDTWEKVIRPTLIDLEGSADFYSTPNGLNDFHTLYQYGQDALKPEWWSRTYPTHANPYMPPAEIEKMLLDLTERAAQQEIFAAFLADGTAVFRNVKACAVALPEAPQDGSRYAIGVDWGRRDFTVMIVMDIRAMRMVHMERSNQLDYHTQRDRLKVLCERYRPTAIVAEENSIGVPIIEELRRDKLYITPFQTTNASKMRIIDNLALLFEREAVAILNDPILLGELLAYDSTRLPSGLIRYGAPDGMFDDCVMALALTVEACGKEDGYVEYLRMRVAQMQQEKLDNELLRAAQEGKIA